METIRPSSDLRNKYPVISSLTRETKEPVFITVNGREDTVIMGHAQYRKMKAELELLKMLAEAQADVDNERTAPIEDTFSDIRETLFEAKAYEV
ncbi:type II toxin-antitoxin system prevent-host-death family antitoxin [Lacrimispora celerecrescens]|uniref:Antitoxin n=1 Tax=Lacrimispora celerecrescens TaxID=29354 RepID=A0A084JBU4_9FIRM|nr:type II toxin-antitoxin system prevent-host-death family antitoxin [Lacrimispora celerecrescens]KEZ86428.1 prevent-host-death protein [Lacrimispora celerecrescens]